MPTPTLAQPRRRAFLLAFAAVSVLPLVGCGDRDHADNDAAAPPAPTAGTAPAQTGGGKRLTVAVIPKGLTHVFWQSVHAGAEKAGGEMNVAIRWQGAQKEDDRSAQTAIVDDAITSKVDGIVLAPLDKAALVPAIERADKAKIPLTIFDSGADTDKYVSFVATDNRKGGEIAAERMAKILNGKGTVAIIPVLANSSSTNDREAGFEETIKKKYPGIKVVRSNYGNSDRAQSLRVTEDVLQAHPDIAGIFGPNESSIVGALQAVKNRNLIGKIQLVGFDSTKQLEDALKAGDIDSLVLQNPFKMGYEGVKTIVDLKAGRKPEKRIDTGVALMTKENMDSEEIKALRSKG